MTTIETDRQYLWHPFTQMRDWLAGDQLVIERGEGCYLIDETGRRYLDGTASLWVNVHGHNHPALNAAIEAQLGRIAHSTLLGLASPPSAVLAERLVRIAPEGLTKVFFSDNGATSVEIALKMAYQYWFNKGSDRRTTFAYLDSSYHGDTIGAVSVGGIELFHGIFRPLLFDGVRLPSPNCYRCPMGRERATCGMECASAAEWLIRENRDRLAGLVMEPIVQGAAGIVTHPEGYLGEMRRICDENGILLILDEVAVGLGRTGPMFACEREGVRPDILCIAKGLAGGYLPVAATLATQELFDAFLGEYDEFKALFHGHSFTGNALGCAAAVRCLELYDEEGTLRNVHGASKALAAGLRRFADHPNVGDVRQRGLMAGVEIVQDRATKELFPVADKIAIRISLKARDYGLVTRPLGNVLVIVPPLCISVDQVHDLCDALYRATCDVLGSA